ncbi:hypothetical protein ACPB8Q_05885 [Methanocaldococcus indicus]|uniref:hypothetical protein n=1 Tax=Methanocaldococcus indicus TaxID=213231 RepID=UPI003C6D1205
MSIVIERISAKEIFKNLEKKIMITTITNISIGYDVISANSDVISEIENIVSPEVIGYSPLDIEFIDSVVSSLNLSPSVCMGVSISIGRAAANALDIPFYKFLGGAITIDLPTVASAILKDKNNIEIFPIINAESVEEIIEFYQKIINKLKDYGDLCLDGAYRCNDVFEELPKIREYIDELKEDEDLDVLLGISGKKDILKDKDLSLVDYLEVDETLDFDGFICTNEVYEDVDFVKVNPYDIGSLTDLCYYSNYISDKGLSPIFEGNNSTIAHLAISCNSPFIRCNLSSNVLNEIWNIERNLINPNIRRF